MNKKYCFQVKFDKKELVQTTENERKVLIRGLASTNNLDRYSDIVEPGAFAKSIATYMLNPVMLLQHNHEKPIGRFLSANIVPNGIEVVGEILHNEDEVMEKVEKGVMSAFSIGYIPKKYEVRSPDGVLLATEEGITEDAPMSALFDDKNTRIIKELDLLEISIVSIPANAQSVFALEASTKSFFGDMEKTWQEELKSLAEKSENQNEESSENNELPPSGDELVENDNGANEVISGILADDENSSTVAETDENSEKIESEKSFENSEAKNISDAPSKTFDFSTEIKSQAEQIEKHDTVLKSLVELVENQNAEIEHLKKILSEVSVRKGLSNYSTQKNTEKSFFQKMFDEANKNNS